MTRKEQERTMIDGKVKEYLEGGEKIRKLKTTNRNTSKVKVTVKELQEFLRMYYLNQIPRVI